MKSVFTLALVFFCLSAKGAPHIDATGKITSLRTQTSHHTVAASHGETIFKLSNGHHADCPWLSVKMGNDTAISFLLSAQAQDRVIKVWYYSDKKSAAWGSACQVANISLLAN